LEVSDVHKEGCKLKWNKPKDDGGEPIEGYSVEKFDADTGMWLRVGTTKDPEMEVLSLVPGHEYNFRVRAFNKKGSNQSHCKQCLPSSPKILSVINYFRMNYDFYDSNLTNE
jgi:hypothetical protein